MVLPSCQVRWNVWDGMDVKLPDVLAPSRVVAGQRILLEGPYCRRWYLGERVPRQSIGSLTFSVPASIPVSMLSEATTELAIVEDMTGQPATEFIIPGGDFAARSEERRVGKECRSRWSPYH